MDGIKLAVTKIEKFLANTDDHVWYGILKRRFRTTKATLSEWKAIIEDLKKEKA